MSNFLVNSYIEFPLSWTPNTVPNLVAWYDADDLDTITKDGSNLVSQWDDKTGNGNNVSQSTGSKQPLWVDGAHNSRDTIRFDGSDDWLQRSTWVSGLISDPFTYFIVCTMPTGTSGEKFLLDGGGGNRLIFGRDGTEYRMSTGVDLKGSTSTTSLRQYELILNDGSSSISRNKSSIVSGDAGGGSPNGITMGAALDYAFPSASDICELLCYSSAVSSDDTDLIETYLEDKWGQP